ncbi:MAG: hypothetical protein ACYC64_19415 [Armatimonadota bacterium]
MTRHPTVLAFACLGIVVAACSSITAEPTTLNLIPIVDTQPAGTVSLDFYNATVWSSTGSAPISLVATEYGIGNKFEMGFDPVLSSGSTVLINGKFRFFDETRLRPAAAIGVQNTGPNLSSQPYIVACKTFTSARLHFGVIGDEGTARAMLGVSRQYGELFTLQSDYMSGSGNWFTLGFVLGGGTGWSLNVAGLVGNSNSSGSGYLIDVKWSGKLGNGSRLNHTSDTNLRSNVPLL